MRRRITVLGAATWVGAVGLTLELVAAGRLAPVHGGGVDVWAAVLGVTLAAMATAYLLGALTAPAELSDEALDALAANLCDHSSWSYRQRRAATAYSRRK